MTHGVPRDAELGRSSVAHFASIRPPHQTGVFREEEAIVVLKKDGKIGQDCSECLCDVVASCKTKTCRRRRTREPSKIESVIAHPTAVGGIAAHEGGREDQHTFFARAPRTSRRIACE